MSKVKQLTQKVSDLEKKLEQSNFLVDICQQMGSCRDIDESLALLLNILVSKTEADRGSIFLNDPQTGELCSRIMVGNYRREIRILNNQGIAGYVFTTGETLLVEDAYKDERFDRTIDEKSGYRTQSILSVPIRSKTGELMGVAQLLNKKSGQFIIEDCHLVEEITQLSSFILANRQQIDRMHQKRQQEMEFLDVVADITAEIKLSSLLRKVMKEATRLLNADRGT